MMSAPPGSCCRRARGSTGAGIVLMTASNSGSSLGQGGQRRGAAARTPGVGALLGTAGSHSDAPAQKSQPPGHGAAYPAIAQHKKVTLPNRALTQARSSSRQPSAVGTAFRDSSSGRRK